MKGTSNLITFHLSIFKIYAQNSMSFSNYSQNLIKYRKMFNFCLFKPTPVLNNYCFLSYVVIGVVYNQLL